MVKYRTYTDVNRNMIEYQMRTANSIPIPITRSTPNQESARSRTSRHFANERNHSKKHSPGEVHQSEEHNTSMEIPPQQSEPIQPNNDHHETVPTTTKKKSCCTIL
jgi:hypothetical protein